jgi:hypothetical protein
MRENDNVAQREYGISTARCSRRDVRHIISFQWPLHEGTLAGLSLGVSGIFFVVTESGVCHCHFQVTKTDSLPNRAGSNFEKRNTQPNASHFPPSARRADSETAADVQINVTSLCKSLLKLYQERAIRSKRKIRQHRNIATFPVHNTKKRPA